MSSEPKTLVIVPIHNEEENIAGVIREIQTKAANCDILVVMAQGFRENWESRYLTCLSTSESVALFRPASCLHE